MTPKSSSSSSSSASKKRATSSSNEATKQPKFKLPIEFITRPHPANIVASKDTCNAIIHPSVLKELEITSGSMCIISKKGLNGIVVLAKAGDEMNHPTNVIMLSSTTRATSNILLGDRLEINKIQAQPPYSINVTIGTIQGVEIKDSVDQKAVEKLLSDCGIVMPGMIFQKFQLNDSDTVDLVITDADDDS